MRKRYTSSEEQRRNFSPYPKKNKKGQAAKRTTSWTLKAFCLSSCQHRRVPVDAKFKEKLVEAGLGEKKIVVPDIDCSGGEFKELLMFNYPKLKDGGGYELLRCVSNTKSLEIVSNTVARVPRLLKSVIGCGRIFIRPIQRDLDLTPDQTILESVDLEVKETKATTKIANFLFLRKPKSV